MTTNTTPNTTAAAFADYLDAKRADEAAQAEFVRIEASLPPEFRNDSPRLADMLHAAAPFHEWKKRRDDEGATAAEDEATEAFDRLGGAAEAVLDAPVAGWNDIVQKLQTLRDFTPADDEFTRMAIDKISANILGLAAADST